MGITIIEDKVGKQELEMDSQNKTYPDKLTIVILIPEYHEQYTQHFYHLN